MCLFALVTTPASGQPDPVTHETLDRRLGVVLGLARELVVTFPGDGVHGAPLRYRDDGLTVTDLNTGLMWEKKVPGPGGAVNCLTALHSVNARCTLAEATGAWITKVNGDGVGPGFGGYSDWRLPNAKELQSIVDYGRCDVSRGAPCVDEAAIHPVFGPTDPVFHWSSTLHLPDPQTAWGVGFIGGGVILPTPGPVSRAVRAVRSARPLDPREAPPTPLVVTHRTLDEKLRLTIDLLLRPTLALPGDGVRGAPLRYRDNGDGTMTDLHTGLMWEKKVPGSSGLHAVDARYTFDEATGDWIAWVNAEGGRGFAGHGDWRVPNAKELHSIVDYGRCSRPSVPSCVDRAAIDPAFGPTATGNSYFSSTKQLHNPSERKVWIVPFTPNGVTNGSPDVPRFVRAVRDAR
jgi:hypothetical protein